MGWMGFAIFLNPEPAPVAGGLPVLRGADRNLAPVRTPDYQPHPCPSIFAGFRRGYFELNFNVTESHAFRASSQSRNICAYSESHSSGDQVHGDFVPIELFATAGEPVETWPAVPSTGATGINVPGSTLATVVADMITPTFSGCRFRRQYLAASLTSQADTIFICLSMEPEALLPLPNISIRCRCPPCCIPCTTHYQYFLAVVSL